MYHPWNVLGRDLFFFLKKGAMREKTQNGKSNLDKVMVQGVIFLRR